MKMYLDGEKVSQVRITEDEKAVVFQFDYGKDNSVRIIRLKKEE